MRAKAKDRVTKSEKIEKNRENTEKRKKTNRGNAYANLALPTESICRNDRTQGGLRVEVKDREKTKQTKRICDLGTVYGVDLRNREKTGRVDAGGRRSSI